jgi:hypothetical protein
MPPSKCIDLNGFTFAEDILERATCLDSPSLRSVVEGILGASSREEVRTLSRVLSESVGHKRSILVDIHRSVESFSQEEDDDS